MFANFLSLYMWRYFHVYRYMREKRHSIKGHKEITCELVVVVGSSLKLKESLDLSDQWGTRLSCKHLLHPHLYNLPLSPNSCLNTATSECCGERL